VKYK